MAEWKKDYIRALYILTRGTIVVLAALVVVTPHSTGWVWL